MSLALAPEKSSMCLVILS